MASDLSDLVRGREGVAEVPGAGGLQQKVAKRRQPKANLDWAGV